MGFIANAICLQEEAENSLQAERNFKKSCRICGEKGLLSYDCDRCPVRAAHERTMDIFRMREESDPR